MVFYALRQEEHYPLEGKGFVKCWVNDSISHMIPTIEVYQTSLLIVLLVRGEYNSEDNREIQIIMLCEGSLTDMKILYITQFFSSTMGGGEILFFDMAKEMSRRGHEIHVICHKLANFTPPKLEGIRVHYIKPEVDHKNELPAGIKDNLSYIVNAVIRGSSLIRQNRFDLIHTNSMTPVVAGTFLSRLHKIPLICTIHDVFSTNTSVSWKKWAAQNHLSRFSSVLGPIFEKITLLAPKSIIHTVSLSSMDDLKSLHIKTPIRMIPLGIDMNEFPSSESVNVYADYVVFVGRLVFYKNVDILIHAFKDVIKVLPQAKLLIVGAGPMRATWEALAADLNLQGNVIFCGFVSHAEKMSILANASALLMPSSFEGFGLVLLEAFGLKKPVVVPNIRPYDEIVHDKVDGYILSSNDPCLWSEKIIELLKNKELCRDLGFKGRRKVEAKYNNDYIMGHLENLYMSTMKKKYS